MSFWLLVVIFTRFGKFSRHRNRQTPPRRFWVHDVLRRRDDLGKYARLVQELRLGSDSFHRYFRIYIKLEGRDRARREADRRRKSECKINPGRRNSSRSNGRSHEKV